METQKKGINRADFIAVLGVVALGLFTFLGRLFLSGGKLNESVILAVVTCIVAALLLVLMISAKGKESSFKLWRTVEAVVVVLYVAFAYFTAGPILHFFSVNRNNEEIIEAAKVDFMRMEEQFNQYERETDAAITMTKTSLLNAKDGKRTSDLITFCQDNSIEPIRVNNVNLYARMAEDCLLGDDYIKFKETVLAAFAEWKSLINDWNWLKVPIIAKDMGGTGSGNSGMNHNVAAELNKLAATIKLPEVRHVDTHYDIVDYHECNLQPVSLSFPQLLIREGEITAVAVLWCVLIHLVILLSYMVAYRSAKTGVGGGRGKNKTQTSLGTSLDFNNKLED